MKPQDVKSPRARWTLIDVLCDDGGEGDSLAVGEWDDSRVLAARWNGDTDKEIGNPQSRGLPTWFILPKRYYELILETLPTNKKTIARALLRLDK
jgi:hypothetical protein